MPRKSSDSAPDAAQKQDQNRPGQPRQSDVTDGFEVRAMPRDLGPGLFESDELFLPENLKSYRKPVAAIHSIPARRDVSLKFSGRKLMEAMPLAVQLDLRSRSKAEAQEMVRKVREERAAPLFEIRTKELCRIAGLSSTNMERIHETLSDLVGFQFQWNVLGEDGKVEYEAVLPFLIRRDRGVGAREGYTRFAFEPEILLWFLEPNMWANLSWSVMSGLGRGDGPGQEAAFGLYQNIWRYIGTHSKLTPALDLATWIDLIIGPSRFVKLNAKGEKSVVDYKDFKRRYLLPGLAILNGHPALNHTAELKEEKSGRRVVRLRFKLVEKVQGAFDLPLGWPQETLDALEQLGFSDKETANLSQLYPYEQVAEAFKRLPGAEERVRRNGSRVYSRKAFFSGILGNVARGAEQTAEEEARLLKESEKHQQQEDEARRMEQLKRQFEQHQQALIRQAMAELEPSERDALIERHLSARPEDRIMFKGGMKAAYLALFCNWIVDHGAELRDAWLPEPKDQSFQSWLAWRLTSGIVDAQD